MTSKPFVRIAADTNVVLSAAVARAAARVFSLAKGLEFVTTDANFEELPLIVYPTARLLKYLGL